jgi:hypothetical protein
MSWLRQLCQVSHGILLEESTSIRWTFIKLIERYQGLIGILDVEVDYVRLVWFMGEELDH